MCDNEAKLKAERELHAKFDRILVMNELEGERERGREKSCSGHQFDVDA